MTSAMFKDKDTMASFTPSVAISVLSTAVEQEEQCMPMTSSLATCRRRALLSISREYHVHKLLPHACSHRTLMNDKQIYIFAQATKHLLASLKVLLLEELSCKASILYDFQDLADSDISLAECDLQQQYDDCLTYIPHRISGDLSRQKED